MNFLGGLVGVIIGFLLIKYSVSLTETFGRIQWAEEHMHSGMSGTYSLYRVAGVVFIILSLLYMFDALGILLGPLAGVFGGAQ